jgi:hypothetical protein
LMIGLIVPGLARLGRNTGRRPCAEGSGCGLLGICCRRGYVPMLALVRALLRGEAL